jgi:uncharacterized protein (TIGR00255 family)
MIVIRSMTGYGRKETDDATAHFALEIRSLNNRYLDIQVKSPRGLAMMETRVKKAIQDRFARGRFDVFITRNGEQEKSVRLVVNEVLAGQYIAALRDLKSRYGLSGDVEVSTVASLQDIVSVAETKEDPEALWEVLSRGLSQALDELDRMRTEEGAALARDIVARLETIDRLISSIRTKAPATVEYARKRMMEALSKLLTDQPDPMRLAQEIAILAERTDVSEELTRLGSHLKQFRSFLSDTAGEAVGRKLDFLLQEIGREVNTIASKAMDAEISMDVVTIKAELEKIREQVQNIE